MNHDAGSRPPMRFAEAVHHYLGAVAHRQPRQNDDVVAATGAVVAGVDGSPTDDAAVEHAAVEAELRHWNLRLLHVQPTGAGRYPARDQGARLLERMAERARACAPSVQVSSHVAVGAPATVLLAELADTDLVVMGHPRGAAGAAFGLGIGERVADRHHGPALVVRAPGRPSGSADRPIVVGVADPSIRTPALDFAHTEAWLRNCELIVLHTGDGPAPPDQQDFQDGIRVHHRAVAGDPVEALVAASRDAAAVIAGRHADAAGASVGPVGRALVRSAACPVFLIG